MALKIDPDTKDALLFSVGIMGIIAQGVLWAFGVEPSLVLIATFGTMCGIAAATPSLPGRRSGKDDGTDVD